MEAEEEEVAGEEEGEEEVEEEVEEWEDGGDVLVASIIEVIVHSQSIIILILIGVVILTPMKIDVTM